MDIRNDVRYLEKLTNCTEIAGHLQILLIDEVESEESYDEYVFPELTEISGYLFFFSVSKLTSVGKLFPNLRVIRGKELFTDYALVIYDMPDIREVCFHYSYKTNNKYGCHSLTILLGYIWQFGYKMGHSRRIFSYIFIITTITTPKRSSSIDGVHILGSVVSLIMHLNDNT